MNPENLIQEIYKNPKKLFLIDALGAAVTAFMLGIVLVKFEHIFGIPTNTLHFLAGIPIVFILYDLYSYRKGDKNLVSLFIKGIAGMNLTYCIISLTMACNHSNVISIWGWLYILIEIIIILILVGFEWKVANRTTKGAI